MTEINPQTPIPQEFSKEAVDAAGKYDYSADRFFTSKGMGFIAGAEWAYRALSPSAAPSAGMWVSDRMPPDDTKRYAARVRSMFGDEPILCVIKRSGTGWIAGPIAGDYPSVTAARIICWLDEQPSPPTPGA